MTILSEVFAIIAYTGGPEDFLITTHGARELVTVVPQAEWTLRLAAPPSIGWTGIPNEGGENLAAMRTARLIVANEPGQPDVLRIARVNMATGVNEPPFRVEAWHCRQPLTER